METELQESALCIQAGVARRAGICIFSVFRQVVTQTTLEDLK